MSNASREFKEDRKQDNRDDAICCPNFSRTPRKEMTLKAYRKLEKDIKRYCN